MCSSLQKWVTGTNFIVYVSHFLSAWGDRMWSFGIGLFLVSIASENLQLPAVYGLSSSLTVFFLGALVGDWVDHTPRLKAAQLSLVLQNVFVVICVAGVYAYLWFEFEITHDYGAWLMRLCHAGIIVMGILSNLASLARMISVERDWIVEICGKDKDMLAKMTSSLRRIDQATLILAPIATGQIMTFAGLQNGAVFIAAWNVVSVFVEYYLMWKVYNTVPALRAKKESCRADETPGIEAEEEMEVNMAAETPDSGLASDNKDDVALTSDTNKAENASTDVALTSDVDKPEDNSTSVNSPEAGEAGSSVMYSKRDGDKDKEDDDTQAVDVVIKDKKEEEGKEGRGGCGNMLICSRFLALYRGWRTYMRYSVALAGMALACLYMTVLGFDNITVAYAVTQGVSESILGVLMGASAVFGILGTFAYPIMRRRLGLVRTGIFALSCEVTCLILCVVSVWMPGSPFDPLYYINPKESRLQCYNVTVDPPRVSTVLPPGNTSTVVSNIGTSPLSADNSTESGIVTACETEVRGPESYISVGMLMAGIVLARFGLWTADLTITQLFLEAVVEGERGVVNGVQSSLNKLMDVLKFVLVVGVPDIPVFGFLIIVSFLFICLGWLLYAIFLRRQRGHFFHLEKCAVGRNGHAETPEAA
ncbi:ferroportin-like isoform X2 [Babylonia areolata]|uniref:ferroportin-like isoform X2 n=1 Tax=Babylonia areolata TaxID=304850 RepID=UPI003FD3DAC6